MSSATLRATAGDIRVVFGRNGIGKSTLMLQIAMTLPGTRVLYVSGEESEHQIKMRAERLNTPTSDCHVMTETSTQNIFRVVEHFEPETRVAAVREPVLAGTDLDDLSESELAALLTGRLADL